MSESALRARCRGAAPLDARLEPWQVARCEQPAELAALMEEHGSPINLLDVAPMGRNAAELQEAARAAGVALRVFFARKANKAIAFVDEARRLGLGVDVASELELRQVLDRGVAPADVIVTAAVKPRPLLELCVASGVTVAVDNADELAALAAAATGGPAPVPVALRIAPVIEGRSPTRFGMTAEEALATAWPVNLTLTGLHFHLDGYVAADRVAALGQSLALADALAARGHRPGFLDMGGGIPMSYLDDGLQWAEFWRAHRAALRAGEPLTFGGHGLGYALRGDVVDGGWVGYPYHQKPGRGPWLADVLNSTTATGETMAAALAGRGLVLRCEPGRSLLDGCGMTAARVEFRKRRADGAWLVGLAMNRTQCRTTSDDFLVDPLLLPAGAPGGRSAAIDAFLVGAYCIERELLTWRRLHLPEGVAVGDVVVFPNTAGYLMHILESASHQIPLARNLVADGPGTRLDGIDR